jgi:hypothetical protein
VRHLLDRVFPQHWIDRDWPTAWGHRDYQTSPHLFILVGLHQRQSMFKTPVQDIRELKWCITDAIESITPQMLRNVWRDLKVRFDLCWATNGSYVE